MSELDSLVEATVTCIRFERESRELRIEVSCAVSKNKSAIVISGIDELLIDDLRLYNIIDRVSLFTEADALEEINECTSSLFYLMQKRELTTSDFRWPRFRERLASIRSGQLQLMEIEPVAGISAFVLAEKIRIEAISSR